MKRTLLALAVALAACVTAPTGEHVVTGAARPAHAGEVKVVMDGAPLGTDYDELAIVSSSGSNSAATLPAVLGALQEEARKVGGNAVIRVRYDRGANTATATGVAVWMR